MKNSVLNVNLHTTFWYTFPYNQILKSNSKSLFTWEKRFVFFLVQYFYRKAPCDQENSISLTTGYMTSKAGPSKSDLHLPSIDPGPYVIIADPSFHKSYISRESDIPMPPPCSCYWWTSRRAGFIIDRPPEYSTLTDWLSIKWNLCKINQV